jgi:hypothetical protein
LVATVIATVLFGSLLILTVRVPRPIRLRFHIKTMMVLIAALPLCIMGGRDVWATWQRWDDYSRGAEFYSEKERIAQESHRSEPQGLCPCIMYRQAKEFYQYAMWHPWIVVHSKINLLD